MPRGTRVLCPGSPVHFAYGTITPYGGPFHDLQLCTEFVTPRGLRNALRQSPTTPCIQRLRAYIYTVWAPPPSLAATDGISLDFSSWGYLDVSVPPVRFPYLCIQYGMTGHDSGRVAPFGNPRINACLATPRGLSQLPTSFLAFRRPGIHLTPLVA